MKLVTFYADADLPEMAGRNQAGFDWRWAIRELARTARAKLGVDTVTVTDAHTRVPGELVRVGDARAEGVMLWLLDAQAEAIRTATEPILMVSPDTLISGPLNMMFGEWDVCLLTRWRPKPIINSVIAVRPGPAVARLWGDIASQARKLPEHSRQWGADVDALVDAFKIEPAEKGIKTVEGVRVRLMPIDGLFASAKSEQARRLPVPIWDFKGARKRWMPAYAALL